MILPILLRTLREYHIYDSHVSDLLYASAYCLSKLRHISEIKEVTALLDTRCLVGDCISQEINKKKKSI